MTSANVQMPVLFTIADTDGATLFGEGVTNDLIENHLEFLLDRTAVYEAPGYDASGITSSLADAFSDTFFVGDPAVSPDNKKLFFVNMIAGRGTTTVSKKQFTTSPGGVTSDATAAQVVDMFCNKLAHALLKLSPDNKGLEHVPSASKLIPVGGRATITTFDTSVAPSASEKLNVGDVMARVASVHLVGHPLAQAIFANEDEIQTKITTAPAGASANPGGVFKSNLAQMLSAAFGGSQQKENAKLLKEGNVFSELVKFDVAGNNLFNGGSNKTNLIPVLTTAAPFYYNVSGVPASSGVENDALLSLYEQLLAKVVGRSAELADARGAGYNYTLHTGPDVGATQLGDLAGVSEDPTKTITGPFPIKSGDKLSVFIRPLLSFKFDTAVVTNANISFCEIVQEGPEAGSVVQVLASSAAGAAIQTSDATSSAVSSVFPGYADNAGVVNAFQANTYGWMGSPNVTAPLRTLSQTTTNTTAVDVMDQHIWKIQVTL